MKRCDFWKLSLLNVLATPMRSLLTVLGMAIGVGAILAVLTLGDAGRSRVESELMRLGVDKVWLTAGDGDSLRHGDAAALAQTLETRVTEQAYGATVAFAGEAEAEATIVGCSADYLAVMDARLTEGRALYPLEWRRGSRTVLVGRTLAAKLNVSSGDALSVGGQPFRIAGVVRLLNQLSTVDGDAAVFVPIDVFCELTGDAVAELTVSVPESVSPDTMAKRAVAALALTRERRAQAVTMQAQIDATHSVLEIFVNVLKWVALICILVGGIGVMNILLVSVRERRREIGVMKSLGASGAQICAMFLLEALMYAAIGGVCGLAVGFGLIALAAGAIGLYPIVKASDAAFVAAAALVIGLFFGVAPAVRASKLAPVDALRE